MAVIVSQISWLMPGQSVSDTSLPLVWIILSTIILPFMVSMITLYLSRKKDKANIDTGQSEVSLKWAQTFIDRLDKVENENKEHQTKIEGLLNSNINANNQILELQREKRELACEIDKLKLTNVEFTDKINKIEKENIQLRKRVRELEEENKILKKGDNHV